MSNGNIQLQLATLKKKYLQQILNPEVIIIDSRKTEKVKNYSDTYNSLDKELGELEYSR